MQERAIFSDYRPSMSKNPLLVQGDVGHTTPSTQDLPGPDYRYGIRSKHSSSVAECFSNYGLDDNDDDDIPVERCLSARRPRKEKQDYIATNKAALRAGCRTAREFRDYKLEHDIPIKQEVKTTAAEKIAFHRKVSNMTHGDRTVIVDEMKDCMTYKTLNDAIVKAIADRQKNIEKAKRIKAKKPNLVTGTRSTNASRGHTYKPPPPPTEAQTFKMKRFRDINRYAIDDKW